MIIRRIKRNGGGISSTSHRNFGLDVVRSIACLAVIASHFFLHTKFTTEPFVGVSMFLQGGFSSVAIGADIYMILTGYLCANKSLNRKFYLGGVKVLLSYLFFSLLTIVVNVYWFHTGMTWKSGLLGILSFSTIPYAWYIEMWIGLFMMIPFLNIWYKALKSKRMKLTLIAIIILLTAPPDFFNRYGQYIVPGFWEGIFPLALYFIGCYIREYQPAVSKKLLLIVLLSIAFINSVVTVVTGHSTYLHTIGDRNGVFMIAMTCAVFLMAYNLRTDSPKVASVFRAISLRSLDIFLCSATFDFYLYPLFMKKYYINQSQFGIYYFVIVPLIFILCYVVASVKRLIFDWLQTALNRWNIPFLLQSQAK